MLQDSIAHLNRAFTFKNFNKTLATLTQGDSHGSRWQSIKRLVSVTGEKILITNATAGDLTLAACMTGEHSTALL